MKNNCAVSRLLAAGALFVATVVLLRLTLQQALTTILSLARSRWLEFNGTILPAPSSITYQFDFANTVLADGMGFKPVIWKLDFRQCCADSCLPLRQFHFTPGASPSIYPRVHDSARVMQAITRSRSPMSYNRRRCSAVSPQAFIKRAWTLNGFGRVFNDLLTPR